eukprot:1977274-Pyramimonas_sp.AAC.1
MPSPLPMLTESHKHWHCPCGKWKPDPHRSGQPRWTEVKKHWRICQSEDPPKEPADVQRRRLGKGGFSVAAMSEAKRDKAWGRFQLWRAELTPAQREVACDPGEGSAGGAQHARMMSTQYVCIKCGKQPRLAKFRGCPCKRRPEGVTLQMGMARLVGGDVAKKRVADSARR